MTTIGNYTILRQIGEGGFARTYEAKHILLEERVCLKQNINITPVDAELLRREARLLWNLGHYSLPSMKDYFAVGDGSYAIAMSFIEGKTLDKVIEKHKAIHPEDVCWIMQRLFGVLHYLHANGIIHSDVKPQNIILQPKIHNAVLIDFGLSANKPIDSTKAIGYTDAFAAPELKAGSPPIPESDLYGAGIVMIYALGGDAIGRTFPQHVPKPIIDFCEELVQNDPILRPNWEKTDLVGRLSDIRQNVFGRRHSA